MSIGSPAGLLALLALGPLVAAYFLRRKQPPRVVSALFLWRSPDQKAEAGPKFKRFSRELSLVFEVLAVLAVTAFLADLRFGKEAPKKHLIIVVDGGFSMRAQVNGEPVSEKVKRAVSQKAVSENASVLTLVESGIRPTVLAGPQMETTRALAVFEKWAPSQPSHDVLAALNFARELAATPDEKIIFFTDGPPPENTELPPNVEAHSLGSALPNFAIVSAQRRDEEGMARLTIRVANFSDGKQSIPVSFTAADQPQQTQELALAPNATGVVRLSMKTSADITVKLPTDALREDSEVTLTAAPLGEVNVALLESLDAPAKATLQRFLQVVPGVTLTPPALVTFGPADSDATVTLGAGAPLKSFVGPFFAQKTNPILDDVQLGGVVWTAGKNPPGRSLMSAGDVVLLSEEDDGRLHLNLEVSRSNVQRTVAWPVLLSNIIRQARLRREGFGRKHLMLGEELPVSVTAGAKWQVKGTDGIERPVLGLGQLLLPAPGSPGAIALLKDGKVVDTAMVLAIDPRESDLQTRGAFTNDADAVAAKATVLQAPPRSLWPVVLTALLLMISLLLTARRTT